MSTLDKLDALISMGEDIMRKYIITSNAIALMKRDGETPDDSLIEYNKTLYSWVEGYNLPEIVDGF